MGRDSARISQKKRGQFHHSPKWPPAVSYHCEANNGQAGLGFLVNKKWKDNITRGIPESGQMGLKMNIAKTKVMVVDNTPTILTNVHVEMLKATYSWSNLKTSRK